MHGRPLHIFRKEESASLYLSPGQHYGSGRKVQTLGLEGTPHVKGAESGGRILLPRPPTHTATCWNLGEQPRELLPLENPRSSLENPRRSPHTTAASLQT